MGLLRGVARTAVVAGTATAVSNRVSRRQMRRWGDQDAQQEAEAQPEAEPVSTDPMTAELENLADLRQRGILTQAEFDAKKKQVLGI